MSAVAANPPSVSAEDGGWAEEHIPLVQGWNLIWLTVDPEPDDVEYVFRDVDFEGVWTFSSGRLPGDRGRWSSYIRGLPRYVNSLRTIHGRRGYVIKAAQSTTLIVAGRPINRPIYVSGQTLDVIGAASVEGGSVTFAKYLSHPSVKDKVTSIYRMMPAGEFETRTHAAGIVPGVGYWVQSIQELTYQGPIEVKAPPGGYQFGGTAYSFTMRLEVPRSSTSRKVFVAARPSVPAAQARSDGVAYASGVDWLQYLDKGKDPAVWRDLSLGAEVSIDAEKTIGELEIRGVRKNRTPSAAAAAASNQVVTPTAFQGLIDVSDEDGNLTTVATAMLVAPVYGTWIGQARLTQVTTQSAIENPPAKAPTQPLSMSLILSIPNPANNGETGRPVQLLPHEYVTVDRDGRAMKREYNTVLFHEPVEMTVINKDGAMDQGVNEILSGQISILSDDAINPYRHRYNPEHRRGFCIVRDIEMQFAASDQDPVNDAMGLGETVGDNELVGTYTELITGLSVEPIEVSGPFRLFRLSDTTDLHTQQP